MSEEMRDNLSGFVADKKDSGNSNGSGFVGQDFLAEPDYTREVVIRDSSNIQLVRYDPKHLQLLVVFRSGKTYQYADIGHLAFGALVGAESVGQAFHKYIKSKNYPYREVK